MQRTIKTLITAGTVVAVALGIADAADAASVTSQAPKLLTPANGGTVGLPVQLSWTPDPNPQTEGYQVEINTTPNFGGGCGGVEECTTGLSQPRDLLHSLPAGIHYWRVRSFHGLSGPDTGGRRPGRPRGASRFPTPRRRSRA